MAGFMTSHGGFFPDYVGDSTDPIWLFGDGSDGDVTISGSTTLTRDMYYDDLTIAATGILNTGGFRVFCKGTCLVQAGGQIIRPGNAGATGAAGGAGGAALGTGSLGPGEGAGGAGQLANGALAATVNNTIVGATAGGAGGNAPGGTGGGGGGLGALNADAGSVRGGSGLLIGHGAGLNYRAAYFGSGGGGGAGAATNKGGGGGGGGVHLHCGPVSRQSGIHHCCRGQWWCRCH